MHPSVFKGISFVILFCVSLALIGIPACTPVFVSEGSPRPNIDLNKSEHTISLAIDKDVPDDFLIPKQNRIKRVKVTSWRTTLEKGFRNGFGKSHKVVSTHTDEVLEIGRADLLFIPEKIFVATSQARAQITYQARLLDVNGKVLKRSAGTVEAKRRAADTTYATANAADAVETMYERIAADFFAP